MSPKWKGALSPAADQVFLLLIVFLTNFLQCQLTYCSTGHLSAAVTSPPIAVTSSWLPDAAAYASDPTPPNVQLVRREQPTPDGSSKSVASKRGKRKMLHTVTLGANGLIFHCGKRSRPRRRQEASGIQSEGF